MITSNNKLLSTCDGVAALSTYFLWLEAGDLAVTTASTQTPSVSSAGAGSSDTSAGVGVGVVDNTIVPPYFLQVLGRRR